MLGLDDFAERYGLSRDTVYFYIKEGVLAPRKKGQYLFDKESEKEIELLQFLKRIGLSMDSIKRMITARRILGPSHPLLRKYLSEFYQEKDRALRSEEEEWHTLLP